MTAGQYVARIVEVPEQGLRLEPTADSTAPDQPTQVNLLGLAVALALGAAGYEHHPEPRDAETQTVEALLAGSAVIPWRHPAPPGDQRVVCDLTGPTPRCRVESA